MATLTVAGAFDAADLITAVGTTSRFAIAIPAAGPNTPAQWKFVTFHDFLAQILGQVPSSGGGGGVTISAD
ncbi:MAG: hypothetical protein OXQ29_11935, partial [Rhodospirillaceae bacterium]|nr:hypothetical protein [Rhodospirillaceae bacterium]